MQTRILFLVASLCGVTNFISAQDIGPALSFQHCYGGLKSDQFRSIAAVPDGGYIAAGFSQSKDGDLTSNDGISDYWIVKLNSDLSVDWQKNYGGSAIDWARSISFTADGGYIVAGYSKSIDGNITNNHGDFDYWILKLDGQGNMIWQKSLGGSAFENAYSVIQDSEGNYVIAGYTESNDGNVSGNHGGQDFWIVKLDPSGNFIWKKTFGGSKNEQAARLIETSDHNYMVVGFSESSDGDVTDNKGDRDFWVIKIDWQGNKLWAKSYGGAKDDAGRWIEQTPDGNFIITGYVTSNAKDVSGNHGKKDYWVIKIDASGNLLWQKCFGGSSDDYPYYIHRCKDGSLLIGGVTESADGDISVAYGNEDGWIVNTDSTGNIRWEKTFGGSKLEEFRVSTEAADGSLLYAGFTGSNNDDVTGNHGDNDSWIVQTCIPPQAVITNGYSLHSCKGTDVTLNALPLANYSYQWYKDESIIAGATSSFYTYSASADASFALTVTDNMDACSTTSATTLLHKDEKPAATITPADDLNICSSGSVTLKANNGSSYSYSWLKNSQEISGATDKNYKATSSGDYKVTVSDQYTGCTKTSSSATVYSSCREQGEEDQVIFSVSPNPNNGIFTISVSPLLQHKNILLRIFDLNGRVILEKNLSFSDEENFTIHLEEEYKSGLYLLTLQSDDEIQKVQLLLENDR